MNTIWEIIYARRPALNYVSPPVCEVIFSGSSNPVIVLSDTPVGSVTGAQLGGVGNRSLTWNVYPGAICYNVYFIGGDNVAVILAQCVTDTEFTLPPDIEDGDVVVTVITEEGEGTPSDPVPVTGGGGGVPTVSVETTCEGTSRSTFPAVMKIDRGAATAGNLTVHYTLSGTAVNGTHYGPIALSAVIPNGLNFVFVDFPAIDASLSSIPDGLGIVVPSVEAILTITPSFTYAISANTASVLVRKTKFRIVSYGDSQALLTPPPEAFELGGCDWDGTFNTELEVFPGFFQIYFRDFDNETFCQGLPTIGGKKVYSIFLEGGPGSWEVNIACTDSSTSCDLDNRYYVWRGFQTGPTPAGIYDVNVFPGNSDSRLTLEIEAFP